MFDGVDVDVVVGVAVGVEVDVGVCVGVEVSVGVEVEAGIDVWVDVVVCVRVEVSVATTGVPPYPYVTFCCCSDSVVEFSKTPPAPAAAPIVAARSAPTFR